MLLPVLWPDKAPLSKGLLLVLNGLTVIFTLLPQYQHLLTYHLQAVQQQQQVRLPLGDTHAGLHPTPSLSTCGDVSVSTCPRPTGVEALVWQAGVSGREGCLLQQPAPLQLQDL